MIAKSEMVFKSHIAMLGISKMFETNKINAILYEYF